MSEVRMERMSSTLLLLKSSVPNVRTLITPSNVHCGALQVNKLEFSLWPHE